MEYFIQWWQSADLITKATVIGPVVGVLALLWAVFTYIWPRGGKLKTKKVAAKSGSVAAGGDMSGNTISVSVPTAKR